MSNEAKDRDATRATDWTETEDGAEFPVELLGGIEKDELLLLGDE